MNFTINKDIPFEVNESDNVYIFKVGKEFVYLSLVYDEEMDSLDFSLTHLRLVGEETYRDNLVLVNSEVIDSKSDFDWLVLEAFEKAGNHFQKVMARILMERGV
jgi:hypothetical protein